MHYMSSNTIQPKKKRTSAKRWAKPSYDKATVCRQTLQNVEIRLCAVCYEEDDSELVGEVEWVQCSNCNVWMHVSYVQNTLDMSNYICDLCL